MISRGHATLLLPLFLLAACSLHAQVTSDRLLHAPDEPQNWLTYSGSYAGQRYSLLNQVDLTNVKNLELKWVFQDQSLQKFESTPLVVNGIMYVTQPPNDVIALDAKTGAAFWVYHYNPSPAGEALLRNRQSRRSDSGRFIVHGHGGRAPGFD